MNTDFILPSVPTDAFEADLLKTCGSFSVEPNGTRRAGWGGVATADLAGIETAFVASDLQRIARTNQNIQTDHGEHCFLVLQQTGRSMMIQNNNFRAMLPGDMILIDSAKPSEFVFYGKQSFQVSLHLPRRELSERFGTAFESGLSLPSDAPAAIAVNAIIKQAFDMHTNECSSQHLREALFNILGACFFNANTQRDSILSLPPHAGVLKRAIASIEYNFRDPDFNSARLVKILEISPKQVQRAFQKLSITPTNFILTRRLEFAREQISLRPSTSKKTLISTIAYSSGFSDLSYFNRRFRAAFGCSPGEISHV